LFVASLGLLGRSAVDITDATNGLDSLETVQLVTQLLAQIADVHIDAAIERRQLAAQHFFHQIFPLHYLAGIAQENLEQIVFDTGEFNYFTRAPNIPRVAVHFDVTNTNGFTR